MFQLFYQFTINIQNAQQALVVIRRGRILDFFLANFRLGCPWCFKTFQGVQPLFYVLSELRRLFSAWVILVPSFPTPVWMSYRKTILAIICKMNVSETINVGLLFIQEKCNNYGNLQSLVYLTFLLSPFGAYQKTLPNILNSFCSVIISKSLLDLSKLSASMFNP